MKLSKVNDKYGAPMGRSGVDQTRFVTDAEGEQCRVRLAQVRLDSGGYDNGGAYWGFGERLFRAYIETNDGDTVECFFRANSRKKAKEQLLALEPELKFYR